MCTGFTNPDGPLDSMEQSNQTMEGGRHPRKQVCQCYYSPKVG